MQNKAVSIKKLFIRRMLISAIVQFIVLALIFLLVKSTLVSNHEDAIFNQLTIRDSFTQQEIARYMLLNNHYALNLELHNIADQNKLDKIRYAKTTGKLTHLKNCISSTHHDYQLCHTGRGHYKGITPVKEGSQRIGYIIASKQFTPIHTSTYTGLIIILAIVIGFFLFNFFILFLSIKKRIEGNTLSLLKLISNRATPHHERHLDIREYALIANTFESERKKISTLKEEQAYSQALSNLAEQVAHDIRSPLAAIRAAVNQNTEEGKNVILSAARRLNGIANNLIASYKAKSRPLIKPNHQINAQAEPIAYLVESLISEKQFEYNRSPIDIHFSTHKSNYARFALVFAGELKRILSNIINNAVESIDDRGQVFIKLSCENGKAIIEIRDTGRGIPADDIQKVTDEGFTSKSKGAGLGLYHAKTQISRMQGSLIINSQENRGTTIAMTLPLCDKPAWFCDTVELTNNQTVAILDDDPSIHHLWQMKLAKLENLNIIHLYNAKNALQECPQHQIDLYLIDHELSNETLTGIDIIKQLNIIDKSILVTSNFESIEVREQCEALSLTILPKLTIPHIHIQKPQPIQYILIDDDDIIRMTWEFAAINANVSCKLYAAISDFESDIDRINKRSHIYIDSNLSGNLRGEVYAKQLVEKGFKKVFLTTGFEWGDFKDMHWLSGVIGKSPPF